MADFSTRLRLIIEKFKQPSDGSLELSGNTQIASTGSLKYNVHPNFTGDTQIIDKKYVDDKLVSGVTASSIYNLSSPSTVTIGGLSAQTILTGLTSNEILEKILVKTLYPTLTPPNSTFVITGLASIYEVGTVQTWSTSASFNRGSINPQYPPTASQYRSGLPNTYNYIGTGLPATVSKTGGTDTQTINTYTILAGNNSWSGNVSYDEGVQPYDSKGNPYLSPLSSGTTSVVNRSTTGIYPIFYGTSVSQPIVNQGLVNGATKNVVSSTDTITINWGNKTGEYLWFAIPDSSPDKLGWYISALNKGNIGSPTDLFGAKQLMAIDSPSSYWTGINYKFYVTNGSTSTSVSAPMDLTNTTQQ